MSGGGGTGPTQECLAATIAELVRRYVVEGIAADAYGINGYPDFRVETRLGLGT